MVIAMSLFSGCGRSPQISSTNRKILEALMTAVSSKDPQWLEIVVKHVTEKRNNNEMPDVEFAAINAIVKKAQSGDWIQAQKDSFALCEAQRPTSDDVARRNSKKTPNDFVAKEFLPQ